MQKQLNKSKWLNETKWLSILLVMSILLISILKMAPVHAASSYGVKFSTRNFGIQFLRATADDLSNPQRALFSLTNGAALWYGIEVQSQPAGLHPVAADPLNDLVSGELAIHGLLPPSDIIPLNASGAFFETVHLAASFAAPGQQIKLTLNPFNFPAATFDILNLILQLLGESNTNIQVGLLAPGHLQDILNEVHTANDLLSLTGDFIKMLQAVQTNTLAVLGDANACIDDLLKLFASKGELAVLGKILVLMVGSAIPGIALTLASFAAGLGTFLVTIKLAKFLADLVLSLGSYLFQQGAFPVVILQSVSSAVPITPPTSTLLPTPVHFPTPTPSITIAEFPIPTANSYPYGVTTGPDGNLWFTEDLGNKIGRITPTGTITEFSIPATNSLPHGITTGPDGNLWFGEDNANKIGRITPTGSISEFSIPTASGGPLGITAGPDGSLWFTEYVGNKIGRITPAGSISEFSIPTANNYPYGLTLGPDGNLWFTEQSGNKIGRITPGGTISEFPIPTVDSHPESITLGPDGNLWFTEQSGNKIGRITPGGSISEFPIPTTRSYPEGITIGPDGRLWFAEGDGNKIGQIIIQ